MALILIGLEAAARSLGENATHVALGTGSSTPSNADEMLGSEVIRQPVIANVAQAGMTQVRALFPNNILPATTREIGLFMYGTSATNSGRLLIRTLDTFTRDTEDLLVIFEITLSA